MTLRCPDLPFLPGFNFDPNFGKTRFPKNGIFERVGGIPMMVDKLLTLGHKINTRYPSIYARGEVAELPGWIAFDKKVKLFRDAFETIYRMEILTFDAYFQETLQEMYKSPFQIRACKLYFYLEDGTIKVTEPKVENSGIPQGTLITRQRISFPAPKDDQLYDLIDFNIGREVELYGKVFKIINCDNFTRNFLNRQGIPVPDPIDPPYDPYLDARKKAKEAIFPKKPNSNIDKFGQFLQFDRKVLRFYGYWDDRENDAGYVHNLVINFYLADDTIEITEAVKSNSGKDTGSTFIKRGKLPKFPSELPSPGYYDTSTVLNVLGPSMTEGRLVIDSLNCGKNTVDFYKKEDLAIGAAMNCYGRKIVITDCDPFTRKFYCAKYGIDEFTPKEMPKVEAEVISVPLRQRKLPPWNGYGSFEDSAQCCVTVELKPLQRDIKQFLALDRNGMDSRILRFKAAMRSKIPENSTRRFIISYYLCDNTISVHELGAHKSCFLIRGQVKLPGQLYFTSEPPDYYQPQHLFIGATLNINSFIFVLLDADEYALRWMELHSNEFPKANIDLIVKKLREKLKPIYKDFVAENLPNELPVISYEDLRDKLCAIMGEDWTEHEMITLARHFSAVCRTERHSRSFIRQIVLTELKRLLWDDMERLKEYFKSWDPENTGFLPRDAMYTLIKSCKIPLDKAVIENMLNVLAKNDKCEIDGQDLFLFLDRNYCPMPDVVPMNIKKELWWASEPAPVAGRLIDWCAFNKGLDLEYLFKEKIQKKPEQETD